MGLRPTKGDEDAEWKKQLAGESAYPTWANRLGAGTFACQLSRLQGSAEDDAFIAEVPEDGGTRLQVLENVETGIQEWIETARELDRPIPPKLARRRVAQSAYQKDAFSRPGVNRT